MKKATNLITEQILETVVNAVQDGKGEDIRSLDLTEIPHAMADHFVVCHGNSHTQVKAIARIVEEATAEELGETPWMKEGLQHGEWCLLDYSSVVVHIFYREARSFYGLEELWADAKVKEYEYGV